MDSHQWNPSSASVPPIGAYNANPPTFLPHIRTSPHHDPASPEPPLSGSPASQGQTAYNADQHQTHQPPQTFEWSEPATQPMNDVQSEFDQIQSGHTSPEDRAVLLQVLRERRRLRELELRILEERRIERERSQNPHLPPMPRAQSQSSLYANGGAGIGVDRMALSSFGATGLGGAQRDWQSLHPHPPPLYYGQDVYASAPSSSNYAASMFEPGSATGSTVAPSPIGTNPPSSTSSVGPGFDQLPPGLGLSSTSPSPYDTFGYPAQHGQESRPRLPSSANAQGSVSPESPHQEVLPHGTFSAPYHNALWDGAVPGHQQHGNGVPVNMDPLHIYDDHPRRGVPQQHVPYQASTGRSSGSPYDEPSPPPPQFYPPHHAQYHTGPPGQSAPAVSPTQNTDAAGKKPKKQLSERMVACRRCSQPLCKLLLRGTQEELSVPYDAVYECSHCIAPDPSSSAPSGGYGSGGGGFVGSGLRLTRKRTRQTEDTSLPTVCDVCVRTIGTGGLVPIITGNSQAGARPSAPPLTFAVEVVCHSCNGKYSRCSDCGGGSGRVGVGKWRAKELFENGRKTCRLPHVRVGGGELELGVWEVPWEINERRELGQLMDALRQLWSERVFARLAIPEVLEGGAEDWPLTSGGQSITKETLRGQSKPRTERMYRDVEDVITKGWPARENILRTPPSPDHDQFRRYLALSWAKSRARRERAQGKMPDPAKFAAEGGQDILMDNVRRTTALVPPASTLVGMWLVDWDMRNRSILLSTSAPFESSDAEDKNIIGVGEVLTRVMMDFEKYNMEHPDAPLKSPQHIWVATRSISALGNARMNDTLTRRRGFLPVDEYVSLHPGTDRSLFTHVPDGHAWIDEPAWIRHRQGSPSDPASPVSELEVLVRWLGDDIDMERLDEIKDIEYGRKSKEMQIASRSRKAQQNAAANSVPGMRK